MKKTTKRLLRKALIEVLIYSVLLVIYFLTVLRLLGKPLNELFHLDPWFYAFATLILILVQSVLLEMITSFLIEKLGLEKFE